MLGQDYTKRNEVFIPVSTQSPIDGLWRVGYGQVIGQEGVSWSQDEANFNFSAKYSYVEQITAEHVMVVWADLSTIRKAALVDIAYQMDGSIKPFRTLILATRQKNWQVASTAILHSNYGARDNSRAVRNAKMLVSDQWPDAPW